MEPAFAYDDAQYVDAARRLRVARDSWFDAVGTPVDPDDEDAAAWLHDVSVTHSWYLAALSEVQYHEDRILQAQQRAMMPQTPRAEPLRFGKVTR